MIKRRRNLLWYVRMILIGFWFSLVSVFILPLALCRPRNTANNSLFVSTLCPIGRRILGIRVINRGRHIIDSSQPAVFVMNHQAALDILVNAELYPKRCVLILKWPLLFIPVFGWLVYLAGDLLIKRQNRHHSLSKMGVADEAISKRKLSIWIFPEGTRSHWRGLGKFKKGAFVLAIKNQVPIVPVVVSSYFKSLNFSKWKAGTVVIETLQPISTSGLTLEEMPQLLQQTEDIMRAEIARIDHQLASQHESIATKSVIKPLTSQYTN